MIKLNIMLPRICPACKHKSVSFDRDYLYCTNCKIFKKPLNFVQRPLAWAASRQWWWRILILAWFVVMLFQNLHNPWFAIARLNNPFSALDLGIHELGHILFSPFGLLMHIAGGSIFQIMFAILWLIALWRKRWYFASAMCWCWLGLNLFDVAAYAADARARLLPLTTGIGGLYEQGSDESYDKAHDWYQILLRTHHLNWDLAIGHALRIAGTSAFIVGFIFGSILLIQMLIGKPKTQTSTN